MLEVDNISVSYDRIWALNDVSLKVEAENIVSIIGANGAGKSTLLKAISGILTLKKGAIRFQGTDFSRISPHQIVRKGIAHVPEGRQIFAPLTVLENLKLGAYYFYGRGHKREIMDLLELVFQTFPILRERKEQVAGTCSGGEQQMLAIGRALMSRPKLLLLDEPSLGLSPLVVQEIFKVLDKLYQEGLTILLVEQNAQLALSFAHYTYILEVGRVALEGRNHELLNDQRVIDSYLGG